MPSATADEGFALPVAKRQKLSDGITPSVGKGSRLFVPFRVGDSHRKLFIRC